MSDLLASFEVNEKEKDAATKQSTRLIRGLLEQLPVEHIAEYRKAVVKLHKQQLDDIDNLLKEKGYVPPTS